MRTTLDLDDALLRAAKKHAASEGKTLTAVIGEALRRYLARPAAHAAKPFRLRLLVKKGRSLPNVNLADRDALYDHMESRR